jgi:hypothetical protein
LAEATAKVAAVSTQGENLVAGIKMVKRLLFNRIPLQRRTKSIVFSIKFTPNHPADPAKTGLALFD